LEWRTLCRRVWLVVVVPLVLPELVELPELDVVPLEVSAAVDDPDVEVVGAPLPVPGQA
jgi:hypothetical protein